MARLVRVCRDNDGDENFQKHQLPVFVDDMRTMIVEFDDPCRSVGVSEQSDSGCSLKQFREKVASFDDDELRTALTVDCDQFNNVLLQTVPCVGCRRSIEKLFSDLARMEHAAIYPLMITQNFSLSVDWDYLTDSNRLYELLIGQRQKVQSMLENLTKCRKNNKRCVLHSLDIHVCKAKAGWEDLWELMSEDCRDECCVVESDSLLDMLETYLQKHRFCSDCRTKVFKAFNLLIGEEDKSEEKGFNQLIYQGLRYCPSEQHLHVKPSVQYLNALVDRVEPELMGGRERHAKTLDVAQGEVLTCLGLYMYDRLHRLVTALKTLQNAFQLLYCSSIIALHRSLQESFEKKHGLSDSFERLCAELQTSTGSMGRNSRHAGNKRGKKKATKSANVAPLCDKNSCKSVIHERCAKCAGDKLSREETGSLFDGRIRLPSPTRHSSPRNQRTFSTPRTLSPTVVNSDSNVGATADDDELSSGDGSCCNDTGYFSQELSPGGGSPTVGLSKASKDIAESCPSVKPEQFVCREKIPHWNVCNCILVPGASGCNCSLLTMLEHDDNENEDDGVEGHSLIADEDVKWFEENQTLVCSKRRALRERLEHRFLEMQRRLQSVQSKPSV